MRDKIFMAVEVGVGIGAAAIGSYTESTLIGLIAFLVGTAVAAATNYFIPKR